MARGIDRVPEGFTIKLVRSRPDCDKCPSAQARIKRAREIFSQLHPFNRGDAAGVDSALFITDEAAEHEPAATLLGEYQEVADNIETTQALCHHKSEEIMRDGQTVGIYCPSADQEYYFGEEV